MKNHTSNILFINPSLFFQQNYHKDLFNGDFPLKSLQLSSILKKNTNISTQFLDLRFEEDISDFFSKPDLNRYQFEKQFIKLLEQEAVQEFDNIGIFLMSSFQYLQTTIVSRIIKKHFPKINIMIAGHLPTAIVEDFIQKPLNFDIILVGEPEGIISELLESINLTRLQNRKKPLVINSNNSFILDQLPFPDYETYLRKYEDKNQFNFTIEASRGCPFSCRFCKIPKTKFRNTNFINFEKRFTALQDLILNHNIYPKISFQDQSFNSALLSKKILNYIIDNKIHETFKFSCQTRLEIVSNHKELLTLLKRAQMVVGYGFETANKDMLLEMNKTRNPSAYIRRMERVLKSYRNIGDPYCRINLIVGFPGENKLTFQDTIRFLEKNAFSHNIQINPTLYLNDPFTYVYNHMNYYSRKYGSVFLKEWWKQKSDPIKNAIPLKPSRNYSLTQLLSDYIEKYSILLRKFRLGSFESLVNWKRYFKLWLENLKKDH